MEPDLELPKLPAFGRFSCRPWAIDDEYHLLIGRDTKAINDTDYLSLRSELIQIRKMIYTLIKRLAPTADSSKG